MARLCTERHPVGRRSMAAWKQEELDAARHGQEKRYNETGKVAIAHRIVEFCEAKTKFFNGWRTIKSLVHKIRLHGRRGKGMAESFSREKLRQAPQKEGGWKIL